MFCSDRRFGFFLSFVVNSLFNMTPVWHGGHWNIHLRSAVGAKQMLPNGTAVAEGKDVGDEVDTSTMDRAEDANQVLPKATAITEDKDVGDEVDASTMDQAEDAKQVDFFKTDFYQHLCWPVELSPPPAKPTSLYDFTDEQHNWAAAQFAKCGESFLESF